MGEEEARRLSQHRRRKDSARQLEGSIMRIGGARRGSGRKRGASGLTTHDRTMPENQETSAK